MSSEQPENISQNQSRPLYCRDTIRVGESYEFLREKYPRLILSENKLKDIDFIQKKLLVQNEEIIDSFMGISTLGIKFIFFTTLRIIFFQDDQDDYFHVPYKSVEAFKTNLRENQLFIFFDKKLEDILMDGVVHDGFHGVHIDFADGVNYKNAVSFMNVCFLGF